MSDLFQFSHLQWQRAMISSSRLTYLSVFAYLRIYQQLMQFTNLLPNMLTKTALILSHWSTFFKRWQIQDCWNLKWPTWTPCDHINIYTKEVIDETTMSSHSHQNAHPALRNMSSWASRVLRKSDSDDNTMSYHTTVGFSVGVNH
jgi:hypothetical protein